MGLGNAKNVHLLGEEAIKCATDSGKQMMPKALRPMGP